MSPPVQPPPISSNDVLPDSLDGLGQSAAALVAAAGHHASLLFDEARLRIARMVRELLFGLVVNITAVLASVVGYALLVREVALWLAICSGLQHPEPIKIGIYLLATMLPLALLKFRVRSAGERDLGALERKHRRE